MAELIAHSPPQSESTSSADAARADHAALNIAFRVGQFPKLSETFILSQIEGMIRHGHRVTVLADSFPTPADTGSPPPGIHEIRYVFPRPSALQTLVARLPWRIRKMIERTAERRLARENDVIICNFGWFGAQMVASTDNLPGRARILTIFHGDDMSRSVAAQGGAIYDALFRHGAAFLPISDWWRDRLVALGAPPQKTTVHRMGVNPELFPYTDRSTRQSFPFRIITVCRFVEKKGIEYALRAFAAASGKAGPGQLHFELIGEGPNRRALEQLAVDLGISHSVRFRDFMPHREVARAMQDADAFILPSVTASDGDMEGIPVVLMEACASGLPVISTRHSGIPELIQHGVTGLLADERDVDTLSEHILELMQSSELRDQLARQARLHVEENFNAPAWNDKLNTLVLKTAATTLESYR